MVPMGDPPTHLVYVTAYNKVNQHSLVCMHVHVCVTLTCISIAAAWLLEILNGTGAT